jgi:hypothetical protein
MPKNMRPTKVAVPVARATRRNVRSLNSGNHQFGNEHHPANRGVEGPMSTVPAATSVIRCYVANWISWPKVVEPSAAPISIMGPSRLTAA